MRESKYPRYKLWNNCKTLCWFYFATAYVDCKQSSQRVTIFTRSRASYVIQHVRKSIGNRGLTFSREARLATLSDHRPIDRDALDISLNIDEFAISSAGSMERSAYGHRKYINRLVGETSFICVSSSYFCAKLYIHGLSRASMDKDPPSQAGLLDWSIFHPIYSLYRIYRSSSAWIDAASEAVGDKRAR